MKSNYDVIVIGGKGFLGSEFVKFYKNKNLKVLNIDSKNYALLKGSHAKILINANGNSYRYKANKNPEWDFKKSFLSVCKSIKDFSYDLYIYISSVDVYENKNSKRKNTENIVTNTNKLDFYGFHKWLSELYIRKYTDKHLIFRLGTLIGTDMKKGPLIDLLKNKSVFMSLGSNLTMISKLTVVKIIDKVVKLKIKNQIFNLTGSGNFPLKNLKTKYKGIKILNNKKYDYNININKIKKYSDIPTTLEEVKKIIKF